MKYKKPKTFSVAITIPQLQKVKQVAAARKALCTKSIEPTKEAKLETEYDPSTVEDVEKKLEQLYAKGQEIKHEMQALDNVRTSLLWLLKKTTTLETQRNHLDM